jgi:hypothetical protein
LIIYDGIKSLSRNQIHGYFFLKETRGKAKAN